jgi:hypothetical protein
MASKDHAAATTGNGSVSQLSPFQKLVRRMADMAVLDESASRVSGEDINAILEAETEEAMWDADELALYNAQKLSGCDLQVTGFEVRFGSSDGDIKTPFTTSDGRQMYLLVSSFRITEHTDHKEIRLPEVGVEFVWNTSARNIVGKLFWMLDHGWFDPNSDKPVQFRIAGTKLTGGRSVEKIKPVPEGVKILVSAIEPPF